MNAMPEAPIENEDNRGSFSEKWYKKWVELFQGFLGVQNLEATVAQLASETEATKVTKVLKALNSEEKTQERHSFVKQLYELLSRADATSPTNEINELLNYTLNVGMDVEVASAINEFNADLNDVDHKGENFGKSVKEMEERKEKALIKQEAKLKSLGVEETEIEALRAEINIEVNEKRVLTTEEEEEKVKNFWIDEENRLLIDETTQRYRRPEFSNSSEVRRLHIARQIYEKAISHYDQLSADEKTSLDAFLIKQYESNKDLFEILVGKFSDNLSQNDLMSIMATITKHEAESVVSNVRQVERGGGNILNKQLEQMIFGRNNKHGKEMSEWDENDWEQVKVSGLLNINVELYEKLSKNAKDELNLSVNPLVVDEDKKIARVNGKLSDEDKRRVNDFFRKKMLSNVRFLVDESVRLDPNTPDLRATEYVTMMSIMGLSTSMKSDIMNSAKRMTFAFLVFNTPQTEDGYRQLKEYAAQIGPEYSVLSNVMKLREAIMIKTPEGKEKELTDLSQVDFVNAAAQAILDEDDRRHYGLSLEKDANGNYKVGRLYTDMMMASNLSDVQQEDWIPVTRMTLKERLGVDGYEEKMRELGVIKEDGSRDTALEKNYLRQIGKQYWDYYNGIYTYLLMTRASGEFVGNANPDNTKLQTPAGLNENYNYKMDPSAWMTFLNTYDVQNFPEAAQMFRRNGNSSLAAKEGGEVLSYLIETQKSPVSKIPSLVEAWYAKGVEPDKKSLAKLRAVFVGSIFLPDQYHIHGKSEHLSEETKLYEAFPQKYDADGVLKLDPTAQRRDFATARVKMEQGMRALYAENPAIFAGLDFEFIKKTFAHDEVLMKTLNSEVSNFDKMIAFARRWGEDKQIFENLSNKRPDDFTKYAIDYHKEWQQAATALGTKPTWGAFIKMMGVAQRILGKGAKIEPLAMRGYEYMVELRKPRVVTEQYVRQVVNDDGSLSYKDGNYIGELPGRVPVPDLEHRRVTYADKQANNGKSPSIVSISGFPGEVDEEGTEQNVLSSMRAASIITEKTYKHERKHLARSILGWHSDRPVWAEAWDTLTGKKWINYLALEVFNIPPEYFMEYVMGATSDFAGLWWKYLNGQGAPSHH